MFQNTPNSGTPKYGAPATGSFGSVTPGALEMSNVDLAAQFTDMITTQRGFQANSRVITTSDEILQELVNLKR
jgi:flagellar hook protein FlgE